MRVVYDCGSQRGTRRVAAEVGTWAGASMLSAPGDVMNILVVSHFDSDHVNGLPELHAAGFIPELVVLPFLDPAERIIQIVANAAAVDGAALGSPGAGDSLPSDDFATRLAAEPRETLAGLWPDVEVVEVGEGDADPDALNSAQDGPRYDSTDVSVRLVPDVGVSASAPGGSRGGGRDVIWTFLWREHRRPMGSSFDLAARLLEDIAQTLGISEVGDPRALWTAISNRVARGKLAAIYRKQLGDRDLNKYSLVLWSGPATGKGRVYGSRGPVVRSLEPSPDAPITPWSRTGGWLGTGDARLKDVADVDELTRHFGNLLDRVEVVNAPHHGSSHDSGRPLYHVVPVPQGLVLTPADGKNGWNHPHCEMVRAALEEGRAVLRVGDDPSQRVMWSVSVLP